MATLVYSINEAHEVLVKGRGPDRKKRKSSGGFDREYDESFGWRGKGKRSTKRFPKSGGSIADKNKSLFTEAELEALVKAKYLKRTGMPGNYRYSYKEPLLKSDGSEPASPSPKKFSSFEERSAASPKAPAPRKKGERKKFVTPKRKGAGHTYSIQD